MSGYFDRARAEVLPYLPERAGRVLDLGCGAGATLAAVRDGRTVDWAGGVEREPEAAKAARGRYDRLWEGDLERLAPEVASELGPASLDLVLCLDVLEHLVDPWTVVGWVSPLLAPGGRLIVSLPNVRNWKFLWRLAVLGDFRYRDAGLLDRTHLRFFTRETGAELATCGGLRLAGAHNATRYGPLELRRALVAASFGRLEPLIAKQYIFVAEAGAPGTR